MSFNSADGACRHTAASLFYLEATIGRNERETCTSVSCLRVKRKRITENAAPSEVVKFQKSEYRKIFKDCPKLLAREIFNSTLQQLIALMKWLPNTMSKKKRLGTS